MNFKTYLKTWDWLQKENRWTRVLMAGMIVGNIMLVAQVATKKTVVTIQPFTLTEEAWITQNNASLSYKEAWGYALAIMLGNVTPPTAEFIAERIKPLLAPSIYQQVLDLLLVQAKQIKDDRVTIRFEPRTVEFEYTKDKVFVYGYSFTKGASGKEVRTDRTYEFTISVERYAPMLHHIDTYAGRPRTKSVMERIERKEAQKRFNDEKQQLIEQEIERQMGGNKGDNQ